MHRVIAVIVAVAALTPQLAAAKPVGPRLHSQYWVGGGAKAFAGLWDAELSFPCAFATDQDGVARCLPVAHLETSASPSGALYVDTACATAFARVDPGQSPPRYFLSTLDFPNALGGLPAYALGDRLDPGAPVYMREHGDCDEVSTLEEWFGGGNEEFFLFSRVDPSIFAQGALLIF